MEAGKSETAQLRTAHRACLCGLAGALLALVAGLGHRAGLWGFGAGFALLGLAVLLGLAAALLATVALWRAPRHGLWRALAGGLCGATLVALPVTQVVAALTLPPIHDISTDTLDPPQFSALLARRAGADNPPQYAGEDTARAQHAAYPAVRPHVYRQNATVVFNEAVEVAHALGWQVAEADPRTHCVEASVRSLWFGFIDDVVIRVRDTPEGTRVDVRSKSRVGKSDLGANARRIETYLTELDRQLR